MRKTFYQELVASLTEYERKDYEAISSIIDKKHFNVGCNVAIISSDPYLLYLIFISLIRYYGIRIHIVNPAEDAKEIYRLLNFISPIIVIDTDHHTVNNYYNTMWINPESIRREHKYDFEEPDDIDFTVVTYSTYPTKVSRITSDSFESLVHTLVEDFKEFNLIKKTDNGIIPFVSDNPDYLLYYVTLKLYRSHVLPSKQDVKFPITSKKLFLEHNNASTLFITKKELIDLWEDKIISLLEYKIVFNSYLKRRWLVNLLIKRRLKKLFKGFVNVVVIGILDNAYMIEILNNLSFVKVYSIFSIPSALYYGPISTTLESIILADKNYRSDHFRLIEGKSNRGQFHHFFTLITDQRTGNHLKISDNNTKYKLKLKHVGNYGHLSEYFYLGNINNAFQHKHVFIFPETLERVINAYPFVKESVILNHKGKITLIINPHAGVMDSNRLNKQMSTQIIQRMINNINKELPEEYQIKDFDVDDTSVIEKDRNGEIVRFAFNRLNK